MLDIYVHENEDALPSNGEDVINVLLDKRQRAHKIVDEIAHRFNELNGMLTQYNAALKENQPVSLAYDLSDLLSTTGANIETSSEKVKHRFDCWFWTIAIEETRLQALMNQNQREKLDSQTSVYEKGVIPPPFDQPTVMGTITNLLETRWEIFVASAVELFQNLDRNYKTNDGISFRKKIILSGAFSGTYVNTHSSKAGYLDDLQRIFTVLDGKDPTRDKALTRHIERNIREFRDFNQLDYLQVKVCKNGNVHLKFVRQDLVDRLNELIAGVYGHALGYRTAKY